MAEQPELVDFDVDTITFEEAELIEEHAGDPFAVIMDALERGRWSMRQLRAVVFVAMSRADPELTFDDLKGRSIMSAAEQFTVADSDDPKEAYEAMGSPSSEVSGTT